MTPLEKAQQVLNQIVDYAAALPVPVDLPGYQTTQMGAPVIACAVLTVALIDVSPHEQYGPTDCNASQLATYSVVLARECGWTAKDDGTDDPAKVAEVTAILSADGELLWNFGRSYLAYLSKQWSVTWQLTGGLGISTMQLIIGVD